MYLIPNILNIIGKIVSAVLLCILTVLILGWVPLQALFLYLDGAPAMDCLGLSWTLASVLIIPAWWIFFFFGALPWGIGSIWYWYLNKTR